MRTDFNPLALFRGDLPTDGAGHARISVKVPDNLTRYRITAVAVAGKASPPKRAAIGSGMRRSTKRAHR